MKNALDFTYNIKVRGNKLGYKIVNICKRCNTLNDIKYNRCIKCMKKIKK